MDIKGQKWRWELIYEHFLVVWLIGGDREHSLGRWSWDRESRGIMRRKWQGLLGMGYMGDEGWTEEG